MKSIFKTSLIAVALLIGITASAQDKPLTFGVKAGINISNLGSDGDGDAKVGFNGGVTLDYALSSNLYLLTGLEYSMKGTKADGVKLNLSYLQLPVHVGYKLSISDKAKLVFHAGPYLAYAVDGKWKVGGISIDAFGDEIKEASEDAARLKRCDIGLGAGAGVEFGRIALGLGCDFGLSNIYDGSYDGKLTNQSAHLTLGYKF